MLLSILRSAYRSKIQLISLTLLEKGDNFLSQSLDSQITVLKTKNTSSHFFLAQNWHTLKNLLYLNAFYLLSVLYAVIFCSCSWQYSSSNKPEFYYTLKFIQIKHTQVYVKLARSFIKQAVPTAYIICHMIAFVVRNSHSFN